MSKFDSEFQEIGHCGGQYTINVKTAEDGRRGVQLGVRHSRPVPAAYFAIYALPQGIPVGTIHLGGGIGQSWNPPPTPGCFPIFIGSDSQTMFGNLCPKCGNYWRSKSAPSAWMITCPYCGLQDAGHVFRTEGQLKYVRACCERIEEAMSSIQDGEFVVDMDQVADAVGKDSEKPKFYYAEESQQNKFNCQACSDINDILGRYGYCSCCGTHNGFFELQTEVGSIRERITSGQPPEVCVKDTVAAFGSYAHQIAKQLRQRVPMVSSRQKEWERELFHDLKRCAEKLKAHFDIDIFKNLNQDDIYFAIRMFHRRHVYEHNGGEVDERYIHNSGDTSVRLKQVIRESAQTVSRITEVGLKLAQNMHEGFHAIFPSQEIPIRFQQGRAKDSSFLNVR